MIAAALAQLDALADPAKAVEAAAYHKAERRYLGVSVPQVEALVAEWRAVATLEDRIALAAGLWDSDIHEARVAAAKLLTQARIRPDDAVWDMLRSWVTQFDAWALADHAASAISRRLVADPSRLDEVEGWTLHPNMWTRRAALVATLPWTKQNHPKPDEIAARDRVLGWAADMAGDRDWFIQKSIAWWVRELSKHDPDRARAFLASHGMTLRGFARTEAGRLLVQGPAGTEGLPPAPQ
jgi:3-methyladenine DNA glycosylase AlkD